MEGVKKNWYLKKYINIYKKEKNGRGQDHFFMIFKIFIYYFIMKMVKF